MGRVFQFLVLLSCQILFIAPSTQLTFDQSCHSYPEFSPTAALTGAKDIGTISKAWLSYYSDNYDNKDADQERLEIVEDGLDAAFGLLPLRQPDLDDWHRRIIKDDIETIMDVYEKTANSPPDELDIRCDLNWLSEEHNGNSYKQDTAFHNPEDAESANRFDRSRYRTMVWLWSEVHQRWVQSPPKTELCRRTNGFAWKIAGSLVHLIQICPHTILATNQDSELHRLRDDPEGLIFRRSLDNVATSIAPILFHELSHTNADTLDEAYIDRKGEKIKAYRLAGVKGLARRAQGEARHKGKVVSQGNPLRNADSFVYFGIVMFFADGPVNGEGRWTANWGDNWGKGEALIPPGECSESSESSESSVEESSDGE